MSSEGLTFSQRNGLSALPPQLKIGEVSPELRNRLHYPLALNFKSFTQSNFNGAFITGWWVNLLRDHFVLVRHQNVNNWDNDAYVNERALETLLFRNSWSELFDFIEFILCHAHTPGGIKAQLEKAFVDARAAYRVFGSRTIGPVGTPEQAAAIQAGVAAAGQVQGAANHLLSAAGSLRSGDWAGSIRESIHAVESVAVQLAPSKNTLGDALAVLSAQGHVHGSLRKAFGQLYGYASDEEGVRHALVMNDAAAVDEVDALFMLGACASFVSYLVTRGKDVGLISAD